VKLLKDSSGELIEKMRMMRLRYQFCLIFTGAFPNEDEKKECFRNIFSKVQKTSMNPSVQMDEDEESSKDYEQASIPPIKVILQLHMDSQVAFDPRLYFMYLGARIRTTIERWNAVKPCAVYVIVIL
jgi:hypothetical protein